MPRYTLSLPRIFSLSHISKTLNSRALYTFMQKRKRAVLSNNDITHPRISTPCAQPKKSARLGSITRVFKLARVRGQVWWFIDEASRRRRASCTSAALFLQEQREREQEQDRSEFKAPAYIYYEVRLEPACTVLLFYGARGELWPRARGGSPKKLITNFTAALKNPR